MVRDGLDLDGHVVFITGAATGVGHALALGLAARNASVVAAMRGMNDRNAQPARECVAAGIRVVECDILSEASVESAVEQVLSEFGRIDVVINNAAIAIAGPIEAATEEDLVAAFQTNVCGPHRVARAVLPSMRARGQGLFIQMSSSAARWVQPGGGVYSLSKWALEAMSEAMRWELGGFGVDCVLIELGSFRSELRRSKARSVSDTERAADYAEVIRAQAADHAARFTGGNATARPPDALVGPVAELIAGARGTRPLRLVLHVHKAELDRYNDMQTALTHMAFAERGYEGFGQNGVIYCSDLPAGRMGTDHQPEWLSTFFDDRSE